MGMVMPSVAKKQTCREAARALTLPAQRLRHLGGHPVAVHGLHQALVPHLSTSEVAARGAAVTATTSPILLIGCTAVVLTDEHHRFRLLCVLCSWLDIHAGTALSPRRVTATPLSVLSCELQA